MTFARLLVAPTLAFTTLQCSRSSNSRTLQCDSPTLTLPKTQTQPLIDPHQFATGSVLGIAAGLIFKRLGKLFFVVLGGSYLLLRALGGASVPGVGQIRVPWAQARQFLLNRSGLSDTTTRAGEVGESPLKTLVTKDLTFKLSFLATFLIGLINT